MYIPQDLKLEASLISAAMSDGGILSYVCSSLQEEDFFLPRNKRLFSIIRQMHMSGIRLSPDSILSIGKASEKDMSSLFLEDTEYVPLDAAMPFIMELKNQRVGRELLEIVQTIKANIGEKSNYMDLLSHVGAKILDIGPGPVGDQVTQLDRSFEEVVKTLKRIENSPDGMLGLPMGYQNLDHVLSGAVPGEQIIIAARPAMGKTTFGIDICANISEMGHPTLLIELEMRKAKLANRLLFGRAGIDSTIGRRGQLRREDWAKLDGTMEKFKGIPFYLDDTSRMLSEIVASITRAVNKHGVRVVVLDYLGLVNTSKRFEGSSSGRSIQLGYIARTLQQLAVRLDICMVVLHQMNREVEKKDIPAPELSYLAGSGEIERHADTVAFLWRPVIYWETKPKLQEKGVDINGVRYTQLADIRQLAIFSVRKQRNGPCPIDVPLRFIESQTHFVDWHDVEPTKRGLLWEA